MTDWEDMRHFAALARGGSLSAAARLLAVEHATVARRVAALEAELGVKLVDRRGRRLLLTDDGKRIASIAARIESDVLSIERVALATRSTLHGKVTLSAPPALAAARLAVPLATLLAQHPGLALDLIGETRAASLEQREADIVVRLSRPTGKELTVVRLATLPFHFYASPAYLAATPPEAWSFITFDDSMNDSAQTRRLQHFAAGRPVRFQASTSELQQVAARAGAGIAILPEYVAADDRALVALPEPSAPLVREAWLAVHNDLRAAPAVRAVIDCITAAMQERPPQSAPVSGAG
jgi:DNA-binding transcriptional LysR family regulator